MSYSFVWKRLNILVLILHRVGVNNFPVLKSDAIYISPKIAAVFGHILGLSILKGLLVLKFCQSMMISFFKGLLHDKGNFLEIS